MKFSSKRDLVIFMIIDDDWVHFHVKVKCSSHAQSFGVDTDWALTQFNYLLRNVKAKADAIVIDVCSSLKLTEAIKDFR